jgi:hypothetical protein
MRKRRAYQQLVDIAGRSDGQEGGHLPATSDQLLRAYACFASARMRRCRRNAGTQQHTATLDKESPCPREQAYPHPSGALLRIGGILKNTVNFFASRRRSIPGPPSGLAHAAWHRTAPPSPPQPEYPQGKLIRRRPNKGKARRGSRDRRAQLQEAERSAGFSSVHLPSAAEERR